MRKKHSLLIKVSAVFLFGCASCFDADDAHLPQMGYSIHSDEIYFDGEPVFYYGVNAMQTYGLNNASLMRDWRIQIVREFIGNFREQPFAGAAIQGSDEQWYHPLQSIVDQNRTNGMVTILCPFGWVEDTGSQILLTGLTPSEQAFYEKYKLRLRDLTIHFKDQPDVWIEVWNEPFHWNNENGYSHDLWLSEMDQLVQIVRRESNDKIVVVPGNEQGQSEAAILQYGSHFTDLYKNVVFDLHAYEKWLLNVTSSEVESRIKKLRENGFAIVFGEVGVINASELMPVDDFLAAAKNSKVSLLGWLWVQNGAYQNALLNENGEENNLNNLNWGRTYKQVLRSR